MDDSLALVRFKRDVSAQLDALGIGSVREFMAAFPGRHLSAMYGRWPSCAMCGRVEPYGGWKSRCKGLVRVTMRGERG